MSQLTKRVDENKKSIKDIVLQSEWTENGKPSNGALVNFGYREIKSVKGTPLIHCGRRESTVSNLCR